MKRLHREIEQCMSGYGMNGTGELTARFVFPEDFIGFQGHFPGKKILPGICEIQCVISMIERWRGEKAVLQEIVLAKFISPVLPSEEIACSGTVRQERHHDALIKAVLTRDGKKIAEMKLKVRFQKEPR